MVSGKNVKIGKIFFTPDKMQHIARFIQIVCIYILPRKPQETRIRPFSSWICEICVILP